MPPQTQRKRLFPLIPFSHQPYSTLASSLHTAGTAGPGEQDTYLKRTQLESQPAPGTLGPRTSSPHLSRAHREAHQIISIPKGELNNTKRRNPKNLHGKSKGVCLCEQKCWHPVVDNEDETETLPPPEPCYIYIHSL